jgi:predicted GIY-YIG superfamily endonuclease
MYYVYLIRSISFTEKVYIGYTQDLEQRLRTHNSGESVHTSSFMPWKLHAFLAFSSKKKALDFEKYLKSHAGRIFADKRLW